MAFRRLSTGGCSGRPRRAIAQDQQRAVNGVRRQFRGSFPGRTDSLFFNKPIADQTSCTRVGTWLTVGKSRAGKTSSAFTGTSALDHNRTRPPAKPCSSLSYWAISQRPRCDFAMTERGRVAHNQRNKTFDKRRCHRRNRRPSHFTRMHEKVTPVTVRNRTLH
jgi:hypothetical protein